MRALERPYPSFTLVLSQQSCLATYRVSHFGGYYAKSSRMLDLEDPLMRTIDARYDGLDGDSDTLVDLEDAISSKEKGGRMRRLSLSTLVVDLALAVKHRLERFRLIEKEDDLEFAVSTA